MSIRNNEPHNKDGASRSLDLANIAGQLYTDEQISKEQYENLQLKVRFKDPGHDHPFKLISRQNLKQAQSPFASIDEEFLAIWLAEKIGMPHLRIDPLKVDVTRTTALMSYTYAQRNKILPIEVGPDHVVIATAEPHDTAWQQEMTHVLRKEIRLVMTSPSDIDRYLVEFYTVSSSVAGATDDANLPASLTNLEQMLELGKAGNLDANDQHVVRIVDWLLQYAFDQRASDIHIEPRREAGNVRFRIDGLLQQVYQLPNSVMPAVISRIKILGRMDLAEKRRPLDGRLKTKSLDGSEVELRLST
ncbi:GspE/PulE family protein, partial [Pseudomonadota bacterium]